MLGLLLSNNSRPLTVHCAACCRNRRLVLTNVREASLAGRLSLLSWRLSSLIGQFHTSSACRSLARPKNHYVTLGLAPGCDQAQIKQKYYQLSKQFHPDLNTGKDAAKRFAEISAAYEIIGSASSRRQYDRDHFGSVSRRSGASPSEWPVGRQSWQTSGRATSSEHSFGGRAGHERDWQHFQEFQNIWRDRQKAHREAGTRKSQYYNYDDQQRTHYNSADWSENFNQSAAGTDQHARAQREWMRIQQFNSGISEGKFARHVQLVFLIVILGAMAIAGLVESAKYRPSDAKLSDLADYTRKTSTYPDQPGRTAGTMTNADRFWSDHDVRNPWMKEATEAKLAPEPRGPGR